MASAKSFLVNDNPLQNVLLLDSFVDPHIFNQVLIKNNEILIKYATEMVIDARYNLRPDLLSYELYGTNFWYPAILSINKLGSIFQFKAEQLGNRCLVPSQDSLAKVIQDAAIAAHKREQLDRLT